jgi:hypothetical protein
MSRSLAFGSPVASPFGLALMRQLAPASIASVKKPDARTPQANPTELLKRLLSRMGYTMPPKEDPAFC